MGVQDAIGKRYMSDNEIFADAFNYLLYGGDPVIRARELQEADTTAIILPYGNNARLTVQRYRDVKKLWIAKRDRNAIYALLADELQNWIHYAVPVKDMLYDVIDYAKQIEAVARSYRKGKDDGALLVRDDGTVEIRLTREEFLSGFRKTDKLIPVITATIYFGAEEWDGPLSLHEMLSVTDPRLLRAIPDYRVNLIAPARIDDADFGKFRTELGLALKVLKYQNGGADQLIMDLGDRKISRSTAEFLNVQAKLGLKFEEPAREGEINMCKAMETRLKSERENTLLQDIKSLMETVKFTAEQAMTALKVPAADQTRLAGLL